jgi:SAM-dependent methyltransferase
MLAEQLAKTGYDKALSDRVRTDCPLCGSDRYKVLYLPKVIINDPAKLYGAASGIQGAQTIVQCLDCPMIYENPCFPEEDIIAGYSASNEAGHDSQRAMRAQSFLKALVSLKKLLPPPGSKVLDVGTAGGAFLEAAQDFGYDAYGLEPSRYLVEQGKKRGLNIEQGTIQSNPLKPDTFDLITFWDVIEHLAQPKRDLKAIRPLLKKDGVLMINYPDIGTWMAKLAGSRFWWLLSVHLTHFNRASISELCRRSGFKVVGFKPYWQTLEFGYLQSMAVHLKVPLSGLFEKLTPGVIKRIPFPYYASQTTCIAKRA